MALTNSPLRTAWLTLASLHKQCGKADEPVVGAGVLYVVVAERAARCAQRASIWNSGGSPCNPAAELCWEVSRHP